MASKKTKPLAKEQAHQEKAFEYYYGFGEKRSYKKVSKKFGFALSTVKLWGKSFGWKQRLMERELQVAREMATRTLNDEVSRRERSLQIVQMALVHLARAIANGQVKMTLADLDKLIRLEAFLSDLPDSRQEVVFADLRNKTTGELRAMVREEIEMLKEFDVNDQEIEVLERDGKLLSSSLSVPRSNSDSG